MRIRSAVCVAALVAFVLAAGAARADGEREEKEAERLERIMAGLEHGVEALQALKQGELAERVAHLLQELREKRRARGSERSEREVVEGWVELMHMAHDVLLGADRAEHAEVIKHAREALILALKGRTDEEAMKVRNSAPNRARQAEALLLAAEVLADQGKADRAEWLVKLGRRFQGKGKGGENAEREAYLKGLRGRVEVMRSAAVAFREAERKDLVEDIERAIHTGELLLAGRQDEEARAVFERTPKLDHLAELLGHAAHLWTKFGHEKRAAACKELSRYYIDRFKKQQDRNAEERKVKERRQAEARERREAEQHKARDEAKRRADRVGKLEAELEGMQEMLQHMMRELERIKSGSAGR